MENGICLEIFLEKRSFLSITVNLHKYVRKTQFQTKNISVQNI